MGGKYLTRCFIDADYTNIIDMKSCRNFKEDKLHQILRIKHKN